MSKRYIQVGILLAFLLLIALAIGYFNSASFKQKDFKEQIPQLLNQITSWELNAYKSAMTDDAIRSHSDDEWQQMLTKLSHNLGSLVSYQPPEFQKLQNFHALAGNSRSVAIFDIDAQFETQTTRIRLTMIGQNDEIRIQGLSFLAPVQVKPDSPERTSGLAD